MIGDFEYSIDESTSQSDVRRWSALVSESGCQVEFIPPKSYPIIQSKWRHLDYGNVYINYIRNNCPVTALHIPDVRQVKQNLNFKLVYTDKEATLAHYDRLVTVPAESFVLIDNAHPFEFNIKAQTSIGISLNLNTSWLLGYIPNPKLSVACPFPAASDWGAVLLMALRTIVEQEVQEKKQTLLPRSLVTEQLGSLLSLMFLPKEDSDLNTRHQVSVYSKLNRILHDDYHNPDLNAAFVSGKAGISRRHLFNMFSAAGTTFSNALLDIRLANARRMFGDRRYSAFRVCDVAWACGFTDLSHFGRCFKREYGQTPSACKKAFADKYTITCAAPEHHGVSAVKPG